MDLSPTISSRYYTFSKLIGMQDEEGANLPLFRQKRANRYHSVKKMMDLLEIAYSTRPEVPSLLVSLDRFDP